MSSMNTGSIDVNFPIPGINQPSQGFRDNFSAIKSNLDIASDEITDLQNKALVKSPLDGLNIDNNMNNTLISNALIQGFRNTTYSLGNNLSGNVSINLANGDVQYGTVTGNVSLGFTGWPPVGTYGQLILILNVSNSALASTITFPNQVDSSLNTIENLSGRSVSFPKGVTTLGFILSTLDCGANISIVPLNRSRQTTQVVTTVPNSLVGSQGDRPGAIAVDANWIYVCTAPFNGITSVWKRLALNAVGGGTVTSVGLTVPSGLSVSGGPVTTAGTLAVSTSLNGIVAANGSGFTTVTIGDGLSYDGGILIATDSGGGGSYVLPMASSSVLGGVKVDGSSIVIDGSGVISAVGGGGGGQSDASKNTVYGTGAGGSFDTSGGLGRENTFVGYNAGDKTTVGYQNTSVGAGSMFTNTSGILNTVVGFEALNNNTSGSNNVALGRRALYSQTTGLLNVAIGESTFFSNLDGFNNTIIGTNACIAQTTGANNTVIGVGAGISGTLGGFSAPALSNGNDVILVGAFSRVSSATATKQTVIGPYLISKGDNTSLIGGSLGIYNEKNTTTWDTTSDIRIKKNIVDSTDGLNVIENIRVRNFEYRTPEEITDLPNHCAISKSGVQIGVIAQELREILPQSVEENSTGALSVNSDELIWYLVNAVKQLSAEIKELKKGNK